MLLSFLFSCKNNLQRDLREKEQEKNAASRRPQPREDSFQRVVIDTKTATSQYLSAHEGADSAFQKSVKNLDSQKNDDLEALMRHEQFGDLQKNFTVEKPSEPSAKKNPKPRQDQVSSSKMLGGEANINNEKSPSEEKETKKLVVWVGASILALGAFAIGSTGCYKERNFPSQKHEIQKKNLEEMKSLGQKIRKNPKTNLHDVNRYQALDHKLRGLSSAKYKGYRKTAIGLVVLAAIGVIGVESGLFLAGRSPEIVLKKRFDELSLRLAKLRKTSGMGLASSICKGKEDANAVTKLKSELQTLGKSETTIQLNWAEPLAIQKRTETVLQSMKRSDKKYFFPKNQTLADNLLVQNLSLRRRRDLFGNEIGRGGGGILYKIEHPKGSGKFFAVKEAKPGITQPAIAQEIASLEQIPAHRNITKYYGSFKVQNKWIFAFEYAEKGDLHGHIKKNRVELPQVIDLFQGYKALHDADIAHRDIKMANILVTIPQRGEVALKAADFGGSYSREPGTQDTWGTRGWKGAEYGLISQYKEDWAAVAKEEKTVNHLPPLNGNTVDPRVRGKRQAVKREVLYETILPGFSRMREAEKKAAIQTFIRQYDPRSSDIYALGELLERLLANKKLRQIDAKKTPQLETLIRDMKQNKARKEA